MSKVYYDIYVSIPNVKGIIIEHSKKPGSNKKYRVFLDLERVYNPEKKYAVSTKRITIGYCSDVDNKMDPNKNFKKYFSALWDAATTPDPKADENSEDNIPFHLKVGLYAVILLICSIFPIKEFLTNIFGSIQAAAILDFAMYSITYGKSTANSFQDCLAAFMLFSDKIPDESYFSRLFNDITRYNIKSFLTKWAKFCAKHFLLGGVWIIIDG